MRLKLLKTGTLSLVALAVLTFAIACAGEDPTPVPPTATAKPAPTATPVPAAKADPDAPAPTSAPIPTATAIPVVDLEYGTIEYLKQNPGYEAEWGEPKYGGIVKWRTNWPQTNNTPFYGSMYRGLYVTPQYNHLVRPDPWCGFTCPLNADLAESWSVAEDGLTYNIKLRQGVKFRDAVPADEKHGYGDMPGRGDEFVCEDAKASLEFVASEEWQAMGASGGKAHPKPSENTYTCVDGPEGYNLEVTLHTGVPNPSLMLEMASIGIIMVNKDWLEWLIANHPGKEIDKTENGYFLNMGTGGFHSDELQRDIVTKMRKHDGYFREALPFVDGMDMHVIRDNSTAFTAWASGQLDILGQGSGSLQAGQVAQAIRDFPEKPLDKHLYTGGQGLHFNTTRAPFDNPQVRKAVNMVIDRQAWHELQKISEGVYKNEISAMFAPGGAWGNSIEEVNTWPGYGANQEADIAEANRLLDEVYGAGVRPEVTCLTRSDQNYVDRCIFAADLLDTHLNMPVNMNITEGVVERTLWKSCNFDLRSSWLPNLTMFVDPYERVRTFNSAEPSFDACRAGAAGELQDKVDRLIGEIKIELDPTKRNDLAKDWENHVVNEVLYGVPLEFQTLYYGLQPWLKGAKFEDYGVFMYHHHISDRYWLDK